MPVPYKPTGRPRGRPRRHEAPPGLERARLFVERAATALTVNPRHIRRPGRGPRAVVMARNLVAHALRTELEWTLQEIADYLGRENHTSTWAAIQGVSVLVLIGDYAELHAQITAP